MSEAEEESSPLIPTTISKKNNKNDQSNPKNEVEFSSPPINGWTVDVLPLTLMGQPRDSWSSGLSSCFGNYDDFFSSDLEVCILGSIAPCVLYGSNAERLGSTSGSFTNHCMTYTALYLIGNSLFGWNCLAPWFSYTTRTALRRSFNLEGSCESVTRQFGCGGSFVEDEVNREQCEMACDFATHLFCHPCSLCQEGREIRRRLAHPGFNAQPVVVMIPPAEQTIGRH